MQATEDNGIYTLRQWIVSKLLVRNNELARATQSGQITDLEAFAQLVDYAASFTPDCSACLVKNVGAILTGHSRNGYLMSEVLAQAQMLDYDAAYGEAAPLQQAGFATIFQDPRSGPGFGGNQPHHFWYYVQVGYQDGAFLANTAVVLHETIVAQGPGGKNFPDLALGAVGANLGTDLSSGAMLPTETGNYIRSVLSPDSAEAARWEAHYWNWGWPMSGPAMRVEHK
jgi:hypothetical protein